MTQLRRIIVGHNFYPDGEVAVRSAAADLVVIGTHGRTGLAHILLGSVAERVVNCLFGVDCPSRWLSL